MMDILGRDRHVKLEVTRCGPARDAGRKLLVPYVTGGFPGWEDAVQRRGRRRRRRGRDRHPVLRPRDGRARDPGRVAAGARGRRDADVDPRRGAHLDAGIPLAVMTYYNIVFRAGHERFAEPLAAAGIAGAILPDLPLEESGPWCAAADAAGVETVMLAAPTAPDERLPRICARRAGSSTPSGCSASPASEITWPRRAAARGAAQGDHRRAGARRCRRLERRAGRGGVQVADGVVQGASVVRRLMEEGPDAVGAYVAEVRRGDRGSGMPPWTGAERDEWLTLRAVRSGADHTVVPRGRPLLDRGVRDLRGADGGVAGPRPGAARRREGELHARLADVVDAHFDFEHYVDDHMRNIPDHYHAHARPKGGFFGHGLRRDG